MDIGAAFEQRVQHDFLNLSSGKLHSQPAPTVSTGILTTSMQRTRIPGHHPPPHQQPRHSTLHFRPVNKQSLQPSPGRCQQSATTQRCTTSDSLEQTQRHPDSLGNPRRQVRLTVNYAAPGSDSLEPQRALASIARYMTEPTIDLRSQ